MSVAAPPNAILILYQTAGPGVPVTAAQTYIGNMNATSAGYGAHALIAFA